MANLQIENFGLAFAANDDEARLEWIQFSGKIKYFLNSFLCTFRFKAEKAGTV
jgi:hypothetical protein